VLGIGRRVVPEQRVCEANARRPIGERVMDAPDQHGAAVDQPGVVDLPERSLAI
jgi:hypothetical protein